jgi:dTDP-4-amino-4,6-dideoxygalactose transaminase
VRKIKVAEYAYDFRELAAVKEVFDSGWLVYGEKGRQFEKEFARRHHVKHALSVCNATEGLNIAMKYLTERKGEVLCPALTYIATVNCVDRQNCKPVLYDSVGEHDLNLDLDSIKEQLSDQTVGVVVVHYGGHISPDIIAVSELCQERDIFLLEDCAHASVARLGDCYAGTFGDAGVFSFHGTKTLAIGEGGMIVTNRDELAEKINVDRIVSRRKEGSTYDVVGISGKSYMTEYQSAIGLVQLDKLSEYKRRLRTLTEAYIRLLVHRVVVPFEDEYSESDFTPYNFTIILPEDVDRNDIVTALSVAHIETTIEYIPVYDFSVYRGCKGQWQNVEQLKSRLLTLPLNVCMTVEDVEQVCHVVNSEVLKCKIKPTTLQY